MTFDLDKSENREFAILDLLAHVLGIHEGIHEEVADATQEG